MFIDKHTPSFISGAELDAYLAKGWYRMGQDIFTCYLLHFNRQVYSSLWLRLPLKGYEFRSGIRKILRRNGRKFQIFYRPATIDIEKELLYQKYRKDFKGDLPPSLKEALMDGGKTNIYNTYETAVYDGRRLMAFSFFDLGENSLASIKGVYDPDYSAYSLGFYTMLLEIEYGLQNNFEYFYPGYFVPGYSRFDYKLRIGKPEEVEFYDSGTMRWLPMKSFRIEDAPVRVLGRKLSTAARKLTAAGINCEILFDSLSYSNEPLVSEDFPGEEPFYGGPLYLDLLGDETKYFEEDIVIYYNLKNRRFYLAYREETSIEELIAMGASHSFYKQTLLLESADLNKITACALRIPDVLAVLKSGNTFK